MAQFSRNFRRKPSVSHSSLRKGSSSAAPYNATPTINVTASRALHVGPILPKNKDGRRFTKGKSLVSGRKF